MSDRPLTAGGLRGAIDLTALRNQPPAPANAGVAATAAAAGSPGAAATGGAGSPTGGSGGAGSAAGGIAGRSGVVVEGTDTNFQEVANASVGVPMLLVLWAAQI